MTVRLCPRPRGPLVVELEEGDSLEIQRLDGSLVDVAGVRKVRLCRCGATGRVPLCDGSHNRIAFSDPERDEA